MHLGRYHVHLKKIHERREKECYCTHYFGGNIAFVNSNEEYNNQTSGFEIQVE